MCFGTQTLELAFLLLLDLVIKILEVKSRRLFLDAHSNIGRLFIPVSLSKGGESPNLTSKRLHNP
jgi:hypothetical protein